MSRPEVKAFARIYVNPSNVARYVLVGYVPLPTATLLVINRRLESGATGSLFAGRGAVLGLTAEVFEEWIASRMRSSAEAASTVDRNHGSDIGIIKRATVMLLSSGPAGGAAGATC